MIYYDGNPKQTSHIKPDYQFATQEGISIGILMDDSDGELDSIADALYETLKFILSKKTTNQLYKSSNSKIIDTFDGRVIIDYSKLPDPS